MKSKTTLMKPLLIIIITCIVALVACEQRNGLTDKASANNNDSIRQKSLKPISEKKALKSLTIDAIVNDSLTVKWEGGINSWFGFDNHSLIYSYSFPCGYTYPIKIDGNNIIVYWAYKEDCTVEIGIHKKFGLKESPAVGKPFARISIVNDTTVRMEYLYPEWVKAFNEFNNPEKCDTILPVLFYSRIGQNDTVPFPCK